MIDYNQADDMKELLPNIYEVTEFAEDIKEYEHCKIGDIIYNTETDEMRQFNILELGSNAEEIRETYKELIPLTDNDGNAITNKEFIDKMNGLKEDVEKLSNTAETNNLIAYANKLREMMESGEYDFVECNRMQHKIDAIEGSLTMTYLRNMPCKVKKYNAKLYNKYKNEANKKLKDTSKYTFPPINDILVILNNVNINNEKENKLFLTNFYKYIVENKMDEVGLHVYFTLVNILGLVKEHNEFRPNIIHNLVKIIKFFNN